MDAATILEQQQGNLERAIEGYRGFIASLREEAKPEPTCFFFDQCGVGRIAEVVVSAFDNGRLAELEAQIYELEHRLKRYESRPNPVTAKLL